MRTQQSGSKPMSRAAALRHARQAALAAQAAVAGPQLAPEPDFGELPDDVAAAIRAYRAQQLADGTWESVETLTHRLLAGYRPATAKQVSNLGSHLVSFLLWFPTWPGRDDPAAPIEPRELLRPGLVDAYLLATGGPDASLATRRSVLRRALRSLDAAAPPPTIAYQPVAAPYTTAECAALVRLARHQPTPSRCRQLCFVVGLGLGGGLDGRDLRHVFRNGCIETTLPDGTPLLTVQVAGGERPRTVVIRRQYEPLVREALRLHDAARRGASTPVLGREPGRRNITTPVIEHAVTAREGERVEIEVNRLRATWLVAGMCAPIPLADLLRAAGLRSGRSLTDLLPYCPEPDPDEVAAVLTVMRDAVDAAALRRAG